MGDFVGGLLKHLRRYPLPRLSLAGGFGKISKLAAGALDLHSGRSQVDFDSLADMSLELGGSAALAEEVRNAPTALRVLELARAASLPLADAVAARARDMACAQLAGATAVEVLIFDRDGGLVGRANG